MDKKTVCTIALVVALPLAGYMGCHRTADLKTARDFQQAQEAFDQAVTPEDFLKVAGMYQAILDRGIRSGAVLYNQGNALMRAGRRGEAIAAYSEARRYLPGNPYLKANLQYARGETTPAEARKPILEHLFFWQNWISYGGKFHLAAAVAFMVFGFAVSALFVQRRLFARLAMVTGVVFVLLGASAAYDWYRFDYTTHGVIVQDEVVARKGNDDSYEAAFTEPLEEGTSFKVVQRRGPWIFIRLPGGQEGWIDEKTAALY